MYYMNGVEYQDDIDLYCAIIDRFKEYHTKNPAWGSLHIVMDDYNVEDENVAFCYKQAFKEGDEEGQELALLLMQLNPFGRFLLSRLID